MVNIRHIINVGFIVLLIILAGSGGFTVSHNTTKYPNTTNEGASMTLVHESPQIGEPVFKEVGLKRGLNYTSSTPPTMIVNGGIYVTDYNNDGWPDLLTVGGDKPILFKNSGGEFAKTNALPPINESVEGALFFDFNNNGWEDLLLLPQNHTPILLENREGEFVLYSESFNSSLSYPIGATAADYNSDGCLDIFIIQYADWAKKQPRGVQNITVSGAQDNGNPNFLYRGNCNGEFNRVDNSGISGSRWTLAASFVDFTGDGRPDIHVANDFNRDILYVNLGNGRFHQVILSKETNRNAMSSEVADINKDARFDIFVTNIHLPPLFERAAGKFAGRMNGNNLLLNKPNSTFVDRAKEYHIKKGGWGWAAIFADFDNDGDLDLFHTTKQMPITPTVSAGLTRKKKSVDEYLNENPVIAYPQYYEQKNMSFLRKSTSRMGFKKSGGTGVARLDFDKDGDVDLAIAQASGRFLLYENQIDNQSGNWLQIELRGTEGLPTIGTRVIIEVNGKSSYRLQNSRADHLSQDSRLLHLGVGNKKRIDRIRIIWPNGDETLLEDVVVNQKITISPNQSQ